MRRPRANRHRERRAAVFLALDRHAAAMETGQLLHQGQANARAFVRAGTSVLDAVEAFEHAGKVGLRNADAGIADTQLDKVAGRSEFDVDLALKCELEGVRQQIQEDLLPHLPIHVDGFGQGIAIDDKDEAGSFGGRSEHARELGREPREVGRLVRGVDAPGLDAGEIQQCIDQPQQALGIAMRDLLPFPMDGRQRRGRDRPGRLQAVRPAG